MPIVSSVIDWDLPQEDGRRVVRVTFLDDSNNAYIQDFMLDSIDDISFVIVQKTNDLNVELTGFYG